MLFLPLAESPSKSGARIGKLLRVDDIASTPPDLFAREPDIFRAGVIDSSGARDWGEA
jgi:hypothetical protein